MSATVYHDDWTPRQRALYLHRYSMWWGGLTAYQKMSFVYGWEHRHNADAMRFVTPIFWDVAMSYNEVVNSVVRDCPPD